MSFKYRFHLIANGHLDPVWLWDWREGMNEAISTSRTMLAMLDEFPDLTVVRGESALYEFVEKEEPEVFERIRRAIASGRWEFVGGTYTQSDNNLPATETLLRQFQEGQSYFLSRFGKKTDTAWYPDTFGHSAGLPGILRQSAISNFAHCRPFPKHFPIAEHTYWWEGCDGSRVMAYRSPVDWYCCAKRDELPTRLDAYLECARQSALPDIGIFYGLGNHGGGPTRRMMRDLSEWAARHPEVEVIHSGLSQYFATVRSWLKRHPQIQLPEVKGELNFDSRGCYASVVKFKHAYRRTESQVIRAQRVEELVRKFLRQKLPPSDPLAAEWRAVLFNSFHDILPGSSIERAYDDQLAWLGGAFHSAQELEFRAVNALARAVDTRVPASAEYDAPTAVPVLLLNPHPHEYRGVGEWEVQLDWRPIAAYDGPRWKELPIEVLGPNGVPLPFQKTRTEHHCDMSKALRIRVAVPLQMPPRSWQVMTVGYKENPRLAAKGRMQASAGKDKIANTLYSISAKVGEEMIRFKVDGKSWLTPGLGVWIYEDIFGSWGGIKEEPESFFLTKVTERWKVEAVAVLEPGPVLSRLWVRMAGKRSKLELTFTLGAAENTIRVEGRLFFNERSKRAKLVMPGFTQAEYEIPGGSVQRGACGEVPALRWVKASGKEGTLGFASDGISCFDLRDGLLQATLARASRYADDHIDDTATGTANLAHLPLTDQGESRFRFLLKSRADGIEKDADFCSAPVLIQTVPASPGRKARHGNF